LQEGPAFLPIYFFCGLLAISAVGRQAGKNNKSGGQKTVSAAAPLKK